MNFVRWNVFPIQGLSLFFFFFFLMSPHLLQMVSRSLKCCKFLFLCIRDSEYLQRCCCDFNSLLKIVVVFLMYFGWDVLIRCILLNYSENGLSKWKKGGLYHSKVKAVRSLQFCDELMAHTLVDWVHWWLYSDHILIQTCKIIWSWPWPLHKRQLLADMS